MLLAYMDAMTRLKLILEQNFQFIETLGVLSVSRYIFGLLVRLRLLDKDARYGLTYKFQLMEKIKYYGDYMRRPTAHKRQRNRFAEPWTFEDPRAPPTFPVEIADAARAIPTGRNFH